MSLGKSLGGTAGRLNGYLHLRRLPPRLRYRSSTGTVQPSGPPDMTTVPLTLDLYKESD